MKKKSEKSSIDKKQNTHKILLIGGGSGGHIMPLIPLIRELKKKHIQIGIAAAEQDIDRKIVHDFLPEDLDTFFVKTGKLRRYFDWQNFTDIYHTIKAIWTAHIILKTYKPQTLFMKGGFVGVPFVIANKLFLHNIPLYTHESDMSAGLAIRIARPFTKKQLGNFTDPSAPLFYTAEKKLNPYSTKIKRPKLLVLGGSLGGLFINQLIQQQSESLLKEFHITLIAGKGKKVALENLHFQQYELLSPEELANYLTHCDVVISRGGSNSLLEIVNAKKPSIIIPLPSNASRNDQEQNAQYFADKNLCTILTQEFCPSTNIVERLEKVMSNPSLKQSLSETDVHLKAKEIATLLVKGIK